MGRRSLATYALFGAVALFAADGTPPVLRLDGNVVPKQYRLDLLVNPREEKYQGSIEIDVAVGRASSVLWLNSAGLSIESAVVRTSRTVEQQAKPILHAGQFLGLQTDKPVPAGNATLRIVYSGAFRRNATEGLFTRDDGGDRYAYTDFEPMDARSAFPCFDEPNYKASWVVNLRVPSDLKAFANAPMLSETPATDGLKTVKFRATQPISTYLVAFAVGPFEVIDLGTAGRKRTPLRLIVPKGRSAGTDFVRQATPKVFEALEEFFGIPYPFDKLDQIAFPYSAGGMENAGLITYGQNQLVRTAGEDNAGAQRSSARIIAHEIAHQWFGNLTTMQWWDDLWLNEGFAVWMASHIVNKVFPDWNYLLQRQITKAMAMTADTMSSARRIRNPVENAGDIGQAFDGITYNKGASVLAMFENYVGEEAFRKAIKAYLVAHSWKNTTAADFLKALSTASGKNVSAPMSTFLDHAGVPLVRVDLSCAKAIPEVSVRQERLLPVGSSGDRNHSWQAPLCFSYPAGSSVVTECTLLTDPKQTVPLRKASSCPVWVNADSGGTGYYQVVYEGELKGKRVPTAQLSPAEQASVLINVRTLFNSGLIAPEEALTTAAQFANATDSSILSSAVNIFASAETLVAPEQDAKFRRLFTRTFGEAVKRIGWEARPGEDADTAYVRTWILPAMIALGEDNAVQARTRKMMTAWLETGKTSDPALSAAVIRAAGNRADRAMFEGLRTALETWTDPFERSRALAGFSSPDDPELFREVLRWILDTKRPKDERLAVFRSVLGTRLAPVLWEFTKQNYNALANRLPNIQTVDSGALVIRAQGMLCSADARKEVEAFFAGRIGSLGGGPRELAQTLERIDLCAARMAAQQQAMAEYLRKTD